MTGTRLAGGVALVTGGATGIGLGIAERFAHEGAAVAIACRSNRGAEAAERIRSDGGTALYVQADVTSSSDVSSMFTSVAEQFGPVNVLVNNALSYAGNSLIDQDETSWDASIAGVLKGVFLCTRCAVPYMIEAGGGSIVNVSSVNALRFFGNDSYSAGKAAILSLTRATAVRWGREGIRANTLIPATVRTGVWEELLSGGRPSSANSPTSIPWGELAK